MSFVRLRKKNFLLTKGMRQLLQGWLRALLGKEILNPVAPKIFLQILLTVYHTILMVLDQRISYWITKQSYSLYFSLFLLLFLLPGIVLILLQEILPWSLVGIKGLRNILNAKTLISNNLKCKIPLKLPTRGPTYSHFNHKLNFCHHV